MLFAGGLLLGTVVGAGVLLGVREHLASATPGGPAHAQAAAAPAAPPAGTHCGFAPVLSAAPRGDALFALPADARDATAADAQAYLSVGRDAASHGRPRDAEVAFITSCRMAGPADTVELADAKFQLASHYVTVAATDAASRGEALARARALLSESVTLYGTRLGLDDGKTRQAANGLAALERSTWEAAQAPLEVPRELLPERAQYDTLAAALPAASGKSGTAVAKNNPEAGPPATAAMGGPPARKRGAAPRTRDADEADEGAAAASVADAPSRPAAGAPWVPPSLPLPEDVVPGGP